MGGRIGGIPDLTATYLASASGQLDLDATLGSIKIDGVSLAAGATGTAGPDYMQISRGAFNVLNTAFNATDSRTTIYSTAINGIDLSPDPAVVPDEAIISLTPSHLEFLRQDRTFSVTGFQNLFAFTSVLTLDFAPSTMGAFVLFAPTIQYADTVNGFGMGLLFNAGGTFQNDPTVAINMTTGLSYVGQNIYRANAQTITMGRLLDFLSQPRFLTTGGGLLTLADFSHFVARGTIGTGVTVTGNRVCFNAGRLSTFTGTLSGINVGFQVDDLQVGALGAIGLLSTLPAAATTFFIDHQGTAQSRFGGSIGFSAGAGAIDVTIERLVANIITLGAGDSLRVPATLFMGATGQVNLVEGAADRLDLGTGDSFRISDTGQLQFGADVVLSRGAASRLDLASGDDLRLVLGALQFAGTAERIARAAGLLQYFAATRHVFDNPIELASFTVATLPAVAPAGQFIFVSDETGGAVTAFSDGTNWRRTQDRAIVA